MFQRRTANISNLRFFDSPEISRLGSRGLTEFVNSVLLQDEFYWRTARQRSVEKLVCPRTPSAITAGVAIKAANAAGCTILTTTSLTASEQTITSISAQPDVARTLIVYSTATTGDAGFTSANARIVKITGTDIWGNTITDWVPLNSTTGVQTNKAFASVTQIILPVQGDGSDTCSVGMGDGFALGYPVNAVADILEFGVKASAATAYTVTALPTLTNRVGYAASTLNGAIASDATSIVLASGSSFPSTVARGINMEIVGPDGSYEEIIVTAKSSNTLTAVRGANGSTALAWPTGTPVVFRAPMTFAPASITADDRFRINYLTYAL